MAAQSFSSPAFRPQTLIHHPLSAATDPAATWILEFVLRQPIPDNLITQLVAAIPLSSPDIHPHIRKTLLLRRLSSNLSRPERTLHTLELIATLDRQPSHLLKAAYCAAAVECAAAAFSRSYIEFIDVVEKIWMGKAAEGLVSAEFLEWGRRLERSILNEEACGELLKRDAGVGLKAVVDYFEAEFREMGPSFLEGVAAALEEKRMGRGFVAQVGGFESFVKSGFQSVGVEAGIGFVLELSVFC